MCLRDFGRSAIRRAASAGDSRTMALRTHAPRSLAGFRTRQPGHRSQLCPAGLGLDFFFFIYTIKSELYILCTGLDVLLQRLVH